MYFLWTLPNGTIWFCERDRVAKLFIHAFLYLKNVWAILNIGVFYEHFNHVLLTLHSFRFLFKTFFFFNLDTFYETDLNCTSTFLKHRIERSLRAKNHLNAKQIRRGNFCKGRTDSRRVEILHDEIDWKIRKVIMT